jgi:hypothetical protein
VRAVPLEVLKLKGRRGELGQIDCESSCRASSVRHLICGAAVNFSEYNVLPAGQVSLINRVKYASRLLARTLEGLMCNGALG